MRVVFAARGRCSTVALSPAFPLRLRVLLCREFRQRIDRAVSCVSEHAGPPEGMQARTRAGSVHLSTPVIGRTHQDQMRARVALPR